MSDRTYEHIFSEKSKESLKEFFKATKNSETFNDLQYVEAEFKKWDGLIKNLAEIIELRNVETRLTVEDNKETEDVAETIHHIKNLELNVSDDKFNADYLVHAMLKEPIGNIQALYHDALTRIELPVIIEMGCLLKKIKPCDALVECYCTELLFPMMSEKVEDDLKHIFNDLYIDYCSLITEHAIKFLRINDKLDFFLVYLNSQSVSDKEFFPSLLRAFLESYDRKLSTKDIFLLDYFISKNTEYTLMKMVVNILYKNAIELKNDKDYGKLLMKIVDNFGPQFHTVKTQIDYILSIHASIWKMKIKKKINKITVEM